MRISKIIFSAAFLVGITMCTDQGSNTRSRPSKPSEETEGLPGYLDSIEHDVSVDESFEVILGRTTIQGQPKSAANPYRVRLSRLSSEPTLTEVEAVVLGSPISDTVDVSFYNTQSNTTLPSSDLLLPYRFKQSFEPSTSTTNIGLMAVVDANTDYEQRVLLPSSELVFDAKSGSVQLLLAPTSSAAQLQLKVTTATLWLVNYTEDALKVLNIGTAAGLTSVGGATSTPVVLRPASDVSGTSININNGQAYTASLDVQIALSASGAVKMQVAPGVTCSAVGGWEEFSTTKTSRLPSANGVNRVSAKFIGNNQVESPCISASIIHDDIAPTAPPSIDDGTTHASTNSSPTFTWGAAVDSGSGISHYEIAIGTTAGGTNTKNWTNVGKVLSATIANLSLTGGSNYYASVRAVDQVGLISAVTQGNGWTAVALNCPTGFIKVPADPSTEVNTPEFCVMKYEARLSAGGATALAPLDVPSPVIRGATSSTASGGWKYCRDNGAGYDLISNSQWQAIARNLEDAQSPPGNYLNWSNGSKLGNNYINTGHSDGDPNNVCHSLRVNVGDDCDTDDPLAPFRQKRTHTLSNGEVIWDFAGNLSEFVRDSAWINYDGSAETSGQEVYTWNSVANDFGVPCLLPTCAGPQGRAKAAFGPVGDYSYKTGDAGFGVLTLSYSAAESYIFRGGDYNYSGSGDYPRGLFNAAIAPNPNGISSLIGFRCVFSGN